MWMNLENIMVIERSQSQKITYCTIPFIQNVQNSHISGNINLISGCQGMG